MAVSKSFFGIRRKSTKSHTYQTDAYGQQVTKDRVTDVKNPRSVAQMEQRMFMATASAGYAGMKQIVDHSFEGKTYGAPTMAAFTSKNLEAIKADWNSENQNFDYNPYKDRALRPGAYIVSFGSLSPVIETVKNENINVPHFKTQAEFIGATQNKQFETQIVVSRAEAYSANQLASAFAIKVGDMLTAVMIVPLVAGGHQFAWARIKMLKAGTDNIVAANIAQYLAIESNCGATLDYDTDLYCVKIVWPTSFKAENLEQGDDAYAKTAFGVIKSAKENGTWKRSTCVLDVRGILADFNPAMASFDTYPQGENYILNGGV